MCHVVDNTTLYLQILRQILSGHDIGHGKNGFFLASSGRVAWSHLYSAIAKALARRGLADDDRVYQADEAVLEKMGHALGVPPQVVPFQVGGK